MNDSKTAQQILTELEQHKFYGSIEIKFENGRVVLIRKTESIKPQALTDHRNNRGNLSEPS